MIAGSFTAESAEIAENKLVIIDWLIGRFFKNTIYVKIKADLLSVTLVEENHTFEDKPLLAVRIGSKGKGTIIAAGSEAEMIDPAIDDSVKIHNGFDHPRSCIRDFEIASATLRYFIRRVINRKAFVRPIIIMHPLEKIEGGLTEIEHRALRDLAELVGARDSFVWTGRVLDIQEIAESRFPETGGKLGWGKNTT